MAATADERGLFEQVVLGLLYPDGSYGYEIARHFARGGDLAPVGRLGRSQVYALLKDLERRRWARAVLRPGGGGPARRVYTLTGEGRRRFLRWLHEPVDSVRRLRVEFVWKLYFFQRLGLGGLEGAIGEQERVLWGRLAAVEADRQWSTGVDRWVLDLRARLLRAGLEWLAEERDRLVPGGTGGREALS
ncbi:MAG: hypothetical protein Kow0092_32530 [Deferrisomatales bacterium]